MNILVAFIMGAICSAIIIVIGFDIVRSLMGCFKRMKRLRKK